VLNPKQHIATVSRKKGKLSMELSVRVGRGYVPAERNKDPTMPIGWIPIDSAVLAVRKVNYTVTNARVGQMTDYDKLTLEVWTNGAVRPRDAVAYAAKILKEQLSDLHQLRGDRGDEATKRRARPRRAAQREPLPLGRGARAQRPQRQLPPERQHHATSASWCRRPRQDMLKTKNFGRKS
jgi:DNA-directed RNA polymerase subunit alpha